MITRRDFLGGVGLSAAALLFPETQAENAVGPVYDFHTHLFGVGDGGTGCFLSDNQRNRINYKLFLKLLGLSENGRLDQDYVAALVRQLRSSSVQKAVLLAYDGRYDEKGEFSDATNVYVPNDYLFDVVNQYPDLFIPCISINPKRRDALAELDKWAEAGARALKIHPPTQNVDPEEKRFRPFYRRMAEHNIILMVHTGAEHASDTVGDEFSDPGRLLPALEEGCTVIASHAGMGSFFNNSEIFEQFFQNLKNLMANFPNLYADTSILAHMYRWRNIPRILREEEVTKRLVHGSDWPFPSNAIVFWNRLSLSQLLELSSEENLFERDFRLKQALGLPSLAFELGAKLLHKTSLP